MQDYVKNVTAPYKYGREIEFIENCSRRFRVKFVALSGANMRTVFRIAIFRAVRTQLLDTHLSYFILYWCAGSKKGGQGVVGR